MLAWPAVIVSRFTNVSLNSAPRSVIEPASSAQPVGADGKTTSRNDGSSMSTITLGIVPGVDGTYDQVLAVNVRKTSPGTNTPFSQYLTVCVASLSTNGACVPSTAIVPRPGPPSVNSGARSVIVA